MVVVVIHRLSHTLEFFDQSIDVAHAQQSLDKTLRLKTIEILYACADEINHGILFDMTSF